MRLLAGLYPGFVSHVRVNILRSGARLKASTEITVQIHCNAVRPNTNNSVPSLIRATPFATEGFAHDTAKNCRNSIQSQLTSVRVA